MIPGRVIINDGIAGAGAQSAAIENEIRRPACVARFGLFEKKSSAFS